MTKKKPAGPPSAAQLASRAAFAERARSRGKVPVVEIPTLAVGDQVRVKPTARQPVIERGVITKIEGIDISVRIKGYVVRFREHQLVKVV